MTLSMALEEERLRALMAEQAMQDIRSNSSSIHNAAADMKGQEQDLSDAKVCNTVPSVFLRAIVRSLSLTLIVL